MFTKKSNSTAPGTLAVSASIISDGHCITGNLESNGDIRVDGVIKGNVYSKAKVLIGPTGLVEGNIHCQEADIGGQVTGSIITQGLLVLKGNADITGDIHATKLLMEPTVSFNGQCHMGANIVELKQDFPLAINE